jgi:sulfite reductase (ferredoxin)
MQRIKIPLGKLSADQLDVLADLAEEYSDRILHVTTRQDFQLHFVHIEDTPDLMRRLAAAGITTREACGNTVRNVTACPIAGVCREEAFDVSPYAHAATYFLLGHDDTQDFGRKFKVAFSGCKTNPCGLVAFHDVGCIATVRDGKRGFEFYVGGGLGSVPQTAQLLDEFLPPEELLPMCQAVSRVFARLGERANRARARLKFVVKKLGLEEFKKAVLEERAKLRPDPRWTAFLADLHNTDEKPLRPPAPLPSRPAPRRVRPLGQAQRHQAASGGLRQRHHHPAARRSHLGSSAPLRGRGPQVHRRCPAHHRRAEPGHALGERGRPVRALRGPVGHRPGPARRQHHQRRGRLPRGPTPASWGSRRRARWPPSCATAWPRRAPTPRPGVEGLHIKTSGCFNSCGQHHVADIGYLGVSRNVNGRRVPHFQVVIGGQWTNNASTYGLAIGAIPSKRVPAFTKRITELYAKDRQEGESFAAFTTRIGKKAIRAMVEETQVLPAYEQDPSYYSDWGDPREYTIEDMGVGECAGEVVPYVEVGLAASEREIFEAQVMLDEGNVAGAGQRAYSAMLQAARALAREKNTQISNEPEEIAREFRTHLVDTQMFWDQYAGAKFSQYFFKAHETQGQTGSKEAAHQLIEEAQLFVDAAHQCYTKYGASLAAPAARVTP